MNWLHSIDVELQRIHPGDNPGRTRTVARRIAGIALQHHYGLAEGDFLAVLKRCMDDGALPEEVRSAAAKLSARLDASFRSPSADPVGDAMTIVSFVRSAAGSV